MSARNRPRGGAIAKEDLTDELNLWTSILEKLKKAQSLYEKYEEVTAKIAAAEQPNEDDDPATAIPVLENLSNIHREGLKRVDEEIRVLEEEPDELIKNLELLISVRTAMEAEAPQPRERHLPQAASKAATGRNAKRKIDAVSSDASVEAATPAPAQPPEPMVHIPPPSKQSGTVVPMIKKGSRSSSMNVGRSEPAPEPELQIKNVAPSSTQLTFAVGNEVFFRQKPKSKDDDGEGIIAKIKEIVEGATVKGRRYKVQDAEPDEGETPPIVSTTANQLLLIPASSAGLPPLPKGKQVIARYPDTTTFYRAEVMGTGRRETCKLRFEGDDEQDREVERKYVLDVPR